MIKEGKKKKPKEEDVEGGEKKKKDKKDKTDTIHLSTSSFEAGALTASPEVNKTLGRKKHSILGLGLTPTVRLPTVHNGSTASPGFTVHIFPDASRPYLSRVANIGLCLFLFLVGLEIDAGVIRRNASLSATVELAGMVLRFGIGSGLAVAIYKEFIDQSITFTHFMLFTDVTYSITAFPVLCRID
jgi:hypothetical protein